MTNEQYYNAQIGLEFANTAVAAADSRAARKHATAEAEKAREWQEKMYDRQLDDNIAWRTHQEMYNSPEAQMSRYRDAGINPMYAVTQGGSSNIVTPNSTSVPMTQKADTPSPRNLRFNTDVINQARITKAQVKSLEAQANKENALAAEANARAEGLKFDNVGKEIAALINEELKKLKLTSPSVETDSASFVEFKANAIAQAEEFSYEFNQMSFWDARDKFKHLRSVREFERDLNSHQRSKFEYELSQAKSAADIFSVSARWAVANQWINAGAEVLGAAASLVGSFKGTSLMPTHSRNFTESYGDHTSTTFNYNKRVGNEIQSPESMMRTIDLP